MENQPDFVKKYAAFISYSHADNREEGRKWADWLHHSLETYEIPSDLVGQKNQAGETIPNQIYPVFQDEKELSANHSLESALHQNLENAERLIYLSSPKSANSVYVQNEIKYYKQIGKADKIIALILSGEPEYGDQNSENQCFPDALRYQVDKDGEILKNKKEEPLAADVRIPETSQEGFTSPESYRRFLISQGTLSAQEITAKTNQYKERLELAKLKIIAGVLNVPLGELTKRDKAYQLEKIKEKNRRMKRIAAAISALAILAIIMGILAWNQKNKAQKTLAHSLYATGMNKVQNGEIADAAAFIAESLRNGDENARTFAASMLTAKNTEHKIPYSDGYNYKYTKDGRWLVSVGDYGENKRFIQVWDMENNRIFRTMKMISVNLMADILVDNQNRVYIRDGNSKIWMWDFIKDKIKLIYRAETKAAEPVDFLIAPSGRTAVMSFNNDSHSYRFMDLEHLRFVGEEISPKEKNPAIDYFFSDRGDHIVTIDAGNVFRRTAPVFTAYKIMPDGTVQTYRYATNFNYPRTVFNKTGDKAIFWGREAAYLFDFNTMASPVMINNSDNIFKVYFNPDGKTITMDANGGKLVDINTGQVIKEFKHIPDLSLAEPNEDTSPMLSYKAKRVDNQLFVENLNKGQMLLSQLNLDDDLREIITGPDSKVFFIKSYSPKVAMWDYATRKVNLDFIKTASPVEKIFYLDKSKMLCTISNTKVVDFFEAKTGKKIGNTIKTAIKSPSLFFNEENTKFAARSAGNAVSVWNAETGKVEGTYTDDGMDHYLMSPDLKTIFVLNKDKTWKYLDFDTRKKIASGKPGLGGARFSPDSKTIMMFYEGGNVDIMTADGFKKLFSIKSINNPMGDFSTGDKFAISEDANHVRIWSLKDRKPLGQPIAVGRNSAYFKFSDDGSKVYLADKDPAGNFLSSNIIVYDSNSGYPLTMPFAPSGIQFAQLFADESRILTVDRNIGKPVLSVWEVPGKLDISDAVLANDLELYYGRKYDPTTATVLYLNKKYKNADKWYFQDEFSRTITPNTPKSITDNIRRYFPAKNSTQVNVLEKSYVYHPLAKAVIAHYYAQSPETGYLADFYYDTAKRQLKLVKDQKLIAETNKILNLVAQKIYPKK